MFYTHAALDRADALRSRPDRLQALRSDPGARLVPIRSGCALIGETDTGVPQLACLPGSAALPDGCGDEVFLGLAGGRPWFAIPAGALDEARAQTLMASAIDAHGQPLSVRFEELRRIGPLLPADDGALLAYASGLVWWQETTGFCSRCGRPLTTGNGGHVRRCDHPDGAHAHFPRTDPAVIMLVTRAAEGDQPERCLLGRNAGWPPGVFSTLAGFVEPGESLEQAVAREVLEESSVQVDRVRYIASQPWPFPRSIMLGFEARATSTRIECDPNELADARWFSREEMVTFGNWGDAGEGFKLPRPDSIARFLIERWLQRDDAPAPHGGTADGS